MPTSTIQNLTLAQQLLDAIDEASGLHPGFRPAHAKGLMCSGTFTPSSEAAKLTRAPHASRQSTPVTVRYSDGTGLPNIPDNAPQSTPKGMAIRFHLGEHEHSDIIAHSTNGFPVHTGEEFLQFIRAATAFGAGRPEAFRSFLATHPNAKRFVETPKPIPTSFAREAFFAVTSFKFTNADGVSRHGRFRIRPEVGTKYLSNEEAAAKSENFLFDEIGQRLAKEPVKLGVYVQLAEPGDDVADASVTWPESRTEVPFGTITLTARVDDQLPERRKIIFDPLPRVDGIDSSGDPLTQVRADIYLLSGRRRRIAVGDASRAAYFHVYPRKRTSDAKFQGEGEAGNAEMGVTRNGDNRGKEITTAGVFLAWGDSSYTTGIELFVDGASHKCRPSTAEVRNAQLCAEPVGGVVHASPRVSLGFGADDFNQRAGGYDAVRCHRESGSCRLATSKSVSGSTVAGAATSLASSPIAWAGDYGMSCSLARLSG